jgi:hypothetical protein
VAHHGALGAPGRARRVEDRRQFMVLRGDGREVGVQAGRAVGQGAFALLAEAQDMRRTGLEGVLLAGTADVHAWFGIGYEIFDFVAGVGGVERQVDGARAQAGEIQEDRLGRLLDLDRDPVTLPHAKSAEQAAVAAGNRFQVGIGVDAARLRFDEGTGSVGREAAAEQIVEIVGHRGDS